MTELKLNDFDGFNTILFDTHDPDWSKFYNEKTNIFYPPITNPIRKVEYQLDHYALWMVISTFCLNEKPTFVFASITPIAKCYACEWAKNRDRSKSMNCRDSCPLVLSEASQYDWGCGTDFDLWHYVRILDDDSSKKEAKDAAERVAKLRWREV